MSEDREENVRGVLGAIERVARDEKPDFILLNEACTTPYFPLGPRKRSYLEWAEPIPGSITDRVGELAKKYQTCVILPIVERRGGKDAGYYNSCVVIGPDGNIIPGRLPYGRGVTCYSKVHLGKTVYPKYVGDETIYFKSGPGFPVFDTPKARIGVMICYDRRFPESWRVLGLSGAQIVFVPTATVGYAIGKAKKGTAEDLFEPELRTHAYQNLLFVVACNKGGRERIGNNEVLYFGRSCIIGPTGMTLKRAPANRPSTITQEVNLRDLKEARKTFLFYEARKPRCYQKITHQR
jgi:beta-ureidopropionase